MLELQKSTTVFSIHSFSREEHTYSGESKRKYKFRILWYMVSACHISTECCQKPMIATRTFQKFQLFIKSQIWNFQTLAVVRPHVTSIFRKFGGKRSVIFGSALSFTHALHLLLWCEHKPGLLAVRGNSYIIGVVRVCFAVIMSYEVHDGHVHILESSYFVHKVLNRRRNYRNPTTGVVNSRKLLMYRDCL